MNPTTILPEDSILEEAQRIIYGDREKTYGNPAKNLQCIADLWTVYTTTRTNVPILYTVNDVCLMMTLLKIARLVNDPKHRDSKVDVAGYIALMQRVQEHVAAEDAKKKAAREDAEAKEDAFTNPTKEVNSNG